MTHLTAILVLALIAALWLDGRKAHEQAVRLCQRACRQRQVQLLDQTVALQRCRLAWRTEGLRCRRTYHFEFSEEGTGRAEGFLTLRGQVLEEVWFSQPDILDQP